MKKINKIKRKVKNPINFSGEELIRNFEKLKFTLFSAGYLQQKFNLLNYVINNLKMIYFYKTKVDKFGESAIKPTYVIYTFDVPFEIKNKVEIRKLVIGFQDLEREETFYINFDSPTYFTSIKELIPDVDLFMTENFFDYLKKCAFKFQSQFGENSRSILNKINIREKMEYSSLEDVHKQMRRVNSMEKNWNRNVYEYR